MPTAVVVATVVNTNMSEAAFRQRVVEQLRNNDRSLLDTLADADGDANVVTAVLNVDEFLTYLIRRFPKAIDAAISTAELPDGAAPAEQFETRMVSDAMSEGEFMDHVLSQLEAGALEPLVRLSDEAWQAVEDESIGEDFSNNPFLY